MTHSPTSAASAHGYTLRFTPVEWRMLLSDRDFLDDPENSINPRRWMGIPVEIVNDHPCHFGIASRPAAGHPPRVVWSGYGAYAG